MTSFVLGPVEARHHLAALLLNFAQACHIVRLRTLTRHGQENVEVAKDVCQGCEGLKQIVLTYGVGSLRSSLIENFLSSCVSFVAQSMLRFWSIDSSSSVILGLNSGTCAMHAATQKRTISELISTVSLYRNEIPKISV